MNKKIKLGIIIVGLLVARIPIAVLEEEISGNMHAIINISWFALCVCVYMLNKDTFR